MLSGRYVRSLTVRHRKYSIYGANVEEWTSILKLAHQWKFAAIKELAVRELELLTIEAVPKIVIYHTYEIDRTLLIPSYTVLTTREEPISIIEGKELGLETSLHLARAREIARGPKSPSGLRGASPVSVAGQDLDTLIKQVFELAAPTDLRLKGLQNGNGDAHAGPKPAAGGGAPNQQNNSFRNPAGGSVMSA